MKKKVTLSIFIAFIFGFFIWFAEYDIKLVLRNLSTGTTFETKYFKINIPRFSWSLHKNKNPQDTMLLFLGPLVVIGKNKENLNQNVYFPLSVAVFKSLDIDNAKEFYMEKNKKYCDKFIQQPNQTINNFEVEVYDCVKNSEVNRNLIYKDEFFNLSPYTDEFKPQYDKFFEGVWLKEK